MELAPPPGAAGTGAGNGWGKGPREAAARHSRVELVVHPLAVATTSRSDFRSAGSLSLGPGHFRLRGESRNVGSRARWGADIPGRQPRAAARTRSGSGAASAAAVRRVPRRNLSPPKAQGVVR